MADLWSAYASQLPMGASSRDAIVGQTEWGSPVYASPTGVQYWEPLQGETKRGSVARALLDGITSDPWGAVKSGAGAVASGVAEALTAPYRAWKGEAVTNGDVFNTAGIAQLGAMPMKAPEGALRVGAMRSASELEGAVSSLYPDVSLNISGSPKRGYVVNKIVVPEHMRGGGVGGKVMGEIIESAQESGVPIALTPSTDFGGKKSGLERFYKSLGFVPNKGKNKDFSFSESLILNPK